MKKLSFLILFLLCVFYLQSNAQLNLVPNPSFELNNNCPTKPGGTYFCLAYDTVHPPPACFDYLSLSSYFDSTMIGWTSYRETPDYYNACASGTHPDVGVPNNILGTQASYNGNAYIGIVTYNVPMLEKKFIYDSLGSAVWDTTINHYIYKPVWDTTFNRYAFRFDSLLSREIIGTKLDSVLTIGTKYFVTFWACRVKNHDVNLSYKGANNKLGMKFSTVPYSYWNPVPIDNYAQVYIDSIVSDSVAWTRISGSFIADSGYGYISIGNFFDGNNTSAIDVIDTFPFPVAYKPYYYIDDVCVSSDSLTCYRLPNGISSQQSKEKINVYPNPFNNIINIEASDQQLNEIRIYDPISKLIFKEQFTKSLAINTQAFNNGLYFYYIVNKNGFVKSGKIIK
jgi:hypothetical protein